VIKAAKNKISDTKGMKYREEIKYETQNENGRF
jgi:hypothetical protein